MKPIEYVFAVDCRPEMEHVDEEALVAVVNCRDMMDIVVEAIVVGGAAVAVLVDFAKKCSFVVAYFGNSKDLEFVVELANSNFVVVGVVESIVVVEVVVVEASVVVEFVVD